MLINKIDKPLDIIVLAGQSNAEGYGRGPCSQPFAPSPDILSMRDTDNYGYVVDEKTVGTFNVKMPRSYLINIAEERQNTSGKIGCFALSFAKSYADTYLKEGRAVLIIHAAVGATGFAKKNWGVGNVLYERLVRMCRLALDMNAENKLVAVLWHQGEHDAIFRPKLTEEERENTYYGELSSMLSDFRTQFGTVPYIMGDFTDEWKATCENNKAILSAMQRIASDYKAVGIVNTAGLLTNNQELGNGDVFHFSRNSLNLLGLRYFDVYKILK